MQQLFRSLSKTTANFKVEFESNALHTNRNELPSDMNMNIFLFIFGVAEHAVKGKFISEMKYIHFIVAAFAATVVVETVAKLIFNNF